MASDPANLKGNSQFTNQKKNNQILLIGNWLDILLDCCRYLTGQLDGFSSYLVLRLVGRCSTPYVISQLKDLIPIQLSYWLSLDTLFEISA